MIQYHKDKAILIPANEWRDTPGFSKTKLLTINNELVVAIPNTLHDIRLLAKMGYNVWGPIIHDYTWPGEYDPFVSQLETANFLTQNPRASVFDDIGTGKTLAALWATDYLMSKGLIRKVMIFSTLSTLWSVWEDTIFKHFTHRSAQVLHGSKQHRIKALNTKSDFYILNHDGIKVLNNELTETKDIDLIILDESAEFKNSQTDLYEALKPLVSSKRLAYFWPMTGSPMPQQPADIWAQAKLVDTAPVPKYYSWFRDEVQLKVNNYKWIPRIGWEEKCYALCKPCIRHKRDDCTDIPPSTTETRTAAMSKEQEKFYTEMMRRSKVELNEGTLTAKSEGIKIGKLLQIATGAAYGEDKKIHLISTKPKEKILKEVIQEAGNKAIVFSPFTHSLKKIAAFLEGYYNIAIVYGNVSTKKRREIFASFQNEDKYNSLQIIVAHPETMAHGLDLTKSSTVIWWGPPPSYRIYEQANGRITRPGQTKKQTIVHLTCSEIERKTYKRLAVKEKMQGILLELIEGEKHDKYQ